MGLKFTLFNFLLLLSLTSISQQQPQKTGSKILKSNSLGMPNKSITKTVKPALKAKTHTGANEEKNVLASTTESTQKSTEKNSKKNDLTGIWKGYFVQQSFGFFEDRYRFEVQVEQLSNNALSGVTYSYKTTVFYGKANFKGIYTPTTNNILLNELNMVELKIDQQSQPCLMTCYLEYNKMGSLEILSGTYTSRNMKDKSDCGSGKVYLEKSIITDFYKEDFIVKRENDLKSKQKNAGKSPSNKQSDALANLPKLKIVKPGAEDNLLKKENISKPNGIKDTVTIEPMKSPEPIVKKIPKPEVIKSRDNELVKTIIISEKSFKIDLYDNGEIDGDRISVYDNNELIVFNKMLTDKPISFTIKCDEKNPVHEFVMVAENLGTIPPNTSLMIITAGEKRYELFVTSTEQKNAVVRVEYKAK